MSNPKAIPFANIPYLRVWDRLPLNSFAISLLLLLTFVAIALLQDLMLGTDDRASIGDGDDVTPGQQMLLLSGFLFTYLVGYFLFLWVRGFVGDIQALAREFGDAVDEEAVLREVTPGRLAVGVEWLAAFLWVMISLTMFARNIMVANGQPDDLASVMSEILQAMVRGELTIWALVFYFVWTFTLLTHLVAFTLRSSHRMMSLAREIPVSLFRSELLAPLANPFLRSLLLLVASLVVLPGWLFFSEDSGIGVDLTVNFVLCVLVSASNFAPLYVVYRRVSEAKAHELECVNEGLKGEMSAMGESLLGAEGQQLSYVELVQYKDAVQRVWPWPVGPQIQKIILIGLIPPLSWVMAAFVEIWLGAAVE